MTQPLFANWATLQALNVPSLQHEEHKWAILCDHSQRTTTFPSAPPLTTPWCRQGTTPSCPQIIFTDPQNQITCKGEARPQHDTIHQQSGFFEKRAFQNVCESSPIEAVLARLQHPWAAFVLCPHCDKHQCIHLNVLEQNTQISATNCSASYLCECPKYFSPICPTLLHNAAINDARIKGTTLGISVYGHCLSCVLLGTIILRQKSDFLPCISATRHYVDLCFQISVKLVFFEPPIVGKNVKMGTFAPWKIEHD